MGKQALVIFAITLTSAITLSAPTSSEAQNADAVSAPRSSETGLATAVDEDTEQTISDRGLTPQCRPGTPIRKCLQQEPPQETVVTTSAPEALPAASSTTEVSHVKPEQATATKPREPTPPERTTPPSEVTPVVTREEMPEPDTASDTTTNDYLSELAAEIHRLTNSERKQAGLSPLDYDNALAIIAEKHSQDMAQKDFFSHTDPNDCDMTCRFTAAGYDAAAWGENIAWYSADTLPPAEDLAAHFVRDWMHSAGHRRNLLSENFTYEGIGLAQINNKIYATANFADPR